MISFIKGVLALKSPTWIEVEVNGMGFGIGIPLSTFDRLPEKGEKIHLLTYLQVKEDGFNLFGFLTAAEREIFSMLLSISGVGPKISLALLSSLSEHQIEKAILTDDISLLSSVHGIGKKTAERIILDLRDKMKKRGVSIDLSDSETPRKISSSFEQTNEDAVSALITLGYPVSDAKSVIASISKNPEKAALPIEALIREGLNRLMKMKK